ncbi:YeeE/YedE family protein [Gemmatimonas sp.]
MASTIIPTVSRHREQATAVNPVALVAAALVAGALFGFGLALSTMIRPDVVLDFLRFRDLGLMLVMGGGVLVTLVAYQLAPRGMRRPLLGGVFALRAAALDRPTVVGAAIFGIGWGLCGVCPGPAIAGLGAGSWELGWAIAGIALGALLQGMTARSRR